MGRAVRRCVPSVGRTTLERQGAASHRRSGVTRGWAGAVWWLAGKFHAVIPAEAKRSAGISLTLLHSVVRRCVPYVAGTTLERQGAASHRRSGVTRGWGAVWWLAGKFHRRHSGRSEAKCRNLPDFAAFCRPVVCSIRRENDAGASGGGVTPQERCDERTQMVCAAAGAV